MGNAVDGFTYGSEVVGGSSPTHSTEILSHYMFVTTEDDAEFVVRFAVYATTAANLITACQAVEAALRMRYQKLTITWAGVGSAVETFDPDVNGAVPSSGFDQEPNLRKLTADEFPNSQLARGYEFRVRLAQYPNYTDAFGAAAGRRQVDVTEHYDIDNRLVVTMTAEWTQVPSALARAQFLSVFDGVSGYAAYRLSKINATDSAATGATWCVTARDETDPNSFSTLRASRRYEQHVNGRRISTVEVFFMESGQRIITIRGSYYRTISGSGGTYGNVFGTAATSRANFENATTGGRAFAQTATTGQLATLTSGQGGALTYQSNCELLNQPTVVTNEQDDRTDYTLVYRELLQKQSNAATVLDDPNIVADGMNFYVVFQEQQDSPGAPPATSVPGPTGESPSVENSSTLKTVDKSAPPVSPQQATGLQTVSPANPQKPVDVFVDYQAVINKAITNPALYYSAVVEPLLLALLGTTFNFAGVPNASEVVEREIRSDPTTNRVAAKLHVRAYGGSVVLFSYVLGIFNDTGVRVDPAFTGNPHEYYVQQALPKTTMSRKIEAVYKAGGGFSLDTFKTPQKLSGWVKLSDAQPGTTTKRLGIPALGVSQTDLTYAVLEENLVWVAKNVAAGTQSGGDKGPAVQTQAPTPAPARQATGVDAAGNMLAH